MATSSSEPLAGQTESDIAARRSPRQEERVLKDKGRPLERPFDVAGVRGEKTAENVQQRRLAGPRWSEDGQNTALWYPEVDVVEHLDAGKAMRHAAGDEHALIAHAASPGRPRRQISK